MFILYIIKTKPQAKQTLDIYELRKRCYASGKLRYSLSWLWTGQLHCVLTELHFPTFQMQNRKWRVNCLLGRGNHISVDVATHRTMLCWFRKAPPVLWFGCYFKKTFHCACDKAVCVVFVTNSRYSKLPTFQTGLFGKRRLIIPTKKVWRPKLRLTIDVNGQFEYLFGIVKGMNMIDLFKRNVGRYECYPNKSLLIKQTRVAFKSTTRHDISCSEKIKYNIKY